MKQLAHKLSTILISILILLPAATLVEPAYAACGTSDAAKQVATGIDQTTTNPDTSCGQNGITSAISRAVTILSIIVGVAAVIAIILGGFKYITSGGDSGKVANAKSTLVYAIIGLVVAALAQLIVHFVINQSNNAAHPPCPSNPAILKSDPACH
ncbi:MAG TPA: pilin [Candidatus Dormibacteraeota bacterium]|nr:pilin [Candidatus Dormibacteraeota bacterium]